MQVKEVNDEWREKRVGLDTCAGEEEEEVECLTSKGINSNLSLF